MLTHDKIPPRINGYEVIAVCPVHGDLNVSAILGRDTSRALPKYVTALVSTSSVAEPRPEWFWGHYFDGISNPLEEAMLDFHQRTRIPFLIADRADLKRLEQRHEADR